MKKHFRSFEIQNQLIDNNNSDLINSNFQSFKILKNQEITFETELEESVIILILGKLDITCSLGKKTFGPRNSFIDEKAYALYLAPFEKVIIKAQLDSDFVITKAKIQSAENVKTQFIKPDDLISKERGKDNWKRQVTDIIGNDFPAKKLVIGETINNVSNWSSSPPHKHDGEHFEESKQEETYYYRLYPSKGFGVQMLYTTDGELNEAYIVKDKDLVVIPKGYHPVVAGPGYKLYYLWILAGEERELKWYEDPDHSWINK